MESQVSDDTGNTISIIFLMFCCQRDRNEEIIMAWIDQWRHTNKKKKLFRSWKEDTQEIKKEKRSAQFCQNFYERGLL